MAECIYCPSKLVNHINLYRHLLRKHKYRCFKCKIYFKDKDKYRKHKQNNHSVLEGGMGSGIKKKIRKKVSHSMGGAVWCYTCQRWSRGCPRYDHFTRFIPFVR